MTVLEYSKMILEKVSFDETLFRKELLKAIKSLLTEEISELRKWCIEKFGYLFCEKVIPEFILVE